MRWFNENKLFVVVCLVVFGLAYLAGRNVLSRIEETKKINRALYARCERVCTDHGGVAARYNTGGGMFKKVQSNCLCNSGDFK